MQSFALIAIVTLLLGAPQPSRSANPSDAAVLRAVMRDWLWESSSPICIDARILADSGAVTPQPAAMRDGVWNALALDAAIGRYKDIAIEAGGSEYGSRFKTCRPEPRLVTYSFSRPHRTSDGLMVVVRAYSAATPDHAELDTRTRLHIGRRHGRWAVVGHPDEHFQLLTGPKASNKTAPPATHTRP